MKDATRRGFLAASGAGVAAVAVSPAAFAAGTAGTTGATEPEASSGAGSGPVVVYVHDAGRGEVTVMRGEREVVVRDAALVRAITRHTRDLDAARTEGTR